MSTAQRRLMHAAAPSTRQAAAIRKRTGITQAVAREFVRGDEPGPLPRRVAKGRTKR